MRAWGPCAGALLLAAALPCPALGASDEERRQICAEAEQRYQEVVGKPSKEAGVAVVMMYKYTFCPWRLTVKPGQAVRWINVDKRTTHSVWFKDDGLPESDRKFSGETVEMTVDLPAGEHAYLCGPHWERDGMTATLVVAP
ncbi:MAG: copper-binding protein [Alphaproteobacteria bacterium]|nr:copper-binding protein [Alphaproteobacteria bacterium]